MWSKSLEVLNPYEALMEDNKKCMRTAEDIRKDIVEAFFNNPKLGENYIDWHTENGECGLTLMFKNANEEFDIIIRRK